MIQVLLFLFAVFSKAASNDNTWSKLGANCSAGNVILRNSANDDWVCSNQTVTLVAAGIGESNTYTSTKTFTKEVGIGAVGLSNGTLVVRSTSSVAANPIFHLQDNNAGTAFVVTNSSRTGILNSNPQMILHIGSVGSKLGDENIGSYTDSSSVGANLAISRATNDSGAGGYRMYKSRGTHASPTIVQDGDDAGSYLAHGYDGTSYLQTGFLNWQIDGTPGTNDMPGRIVFATTNDGSSSSTEKMRLTNNGRLLLGTTSPPQANRTLWVKGVAGTGSEVGIQSGSDSDSAYSHISFFKTDGTQLLTLGWGHSGVSDMLKNRSFMTTGGNGDLFLSADGSGGQLYLGTDGIASTNVRMRINSSYVEVSSTTFVMDGSGAPATGGALCLATGGKMGKCTSAVDSSGNCTCTTP